MVEFLNGVLGFITWCVFIFIIWYWIYKVYNYLDSNYWLSDDSKDKKTIIDTVNYYFWKYNYHDFKFDEKLLILDMKIFTSFEQKEIISALRNIWNIYFPGRSLRIFTSDKYLYVFYDNFIKNIDYNIS